MYLRNVLAVAVAMVATVSAQAYYDQPLPIACTGPACVNPNGQLPYQDMSVIRHTNGTYFRYSKGNNTGDGLNVATAPNLRGPWNFAFSVLGGALKSACGASEQHTQSFRWAPEIHLINGMYHLYYTVETPDDNGSTCFDQCVALSTTMDPDSWVDQGSMNIPIPPSVTATNGQVRPPYVRLDGTLIADSSDPQGVANGVTPYMVFGSFQFGLYGFPLASNLLTIASGGAVTEIIADQFQTPGSSDIPDQSGNYSEGAYQLVANNFIYLFYSRGDCCAPGSFNINSVYQVQVCRTPVSTGPAGPYVDRDGQNCMTGGTQGANRAGSIFLFSNNQNGNAATVFAPGSVGVLNDPTEGLVMYYQYQDNTAELKNLRFGFNFMTFDSDDWPILTATRT